MFGRSHGYQPKAAGGAPSKTPTGGTSGAKDDQSIRFLGDLERLELKPGDKFVLTCPGILSVHQHRRIQEAWRRFAGGDADALKLLILDGGMKIGAIAA